VILQYNRCDVINKPRYVVVIIVENISLISYNSLSSLDMEIGGGEVRNKYI
jgi:hypothetical protein